MSSDVAASAVPSVHGGVAVNPAVCSSYKPPRPSRLVEILHRAPAEALTERALWNLLFAAGELSLRVDVYRAHELFRAAVARVKLADYGPADPRAAAVEMCLRP